jgi:hypothetical protein
MVEARSRNLEETFAGIDADTLKRRPRRSGPPQVFTLGVGVNNANARNFTYLASTGMVRVPRHPAPGSVTTGGRSCLGRRK